MNQTDQNLSFPKCNQCGSNLILEKKKTAVLGNSRLPITTNTYRCSNRTCQDEIDKRTALRIELQQKQELAKLNRLKTSIKLTPVATSS